MTNGSDWRLERGELDCIVCLKKEHIWLPWEHASLKKLLPENSELVGWLLGLRACSPCLGANGLWLRWRSARLKPVGGWTRRKLTVCATSKLIDFGFFVGRLILFVESLDGFGG